MFRLPTFRFQTNQISDLHVSCFQVSDFHVSDRTYKTHINTSATINIDLAMASSSNYVQKTSFEARSESLRTESRLPPLKNWAGRLELEHVCGLLGLWTSEIESNRLKEMLVQVEHEINHGRTYVQPGELQMNGEQRVVTAQQFETAFRKSRKRFLISDH